VNLSDGPALALMALRALDGPHPGPVTRALRDMLDEVDPATGVTNRERLERVRDRLAAEGKLTPRDAPVSPRRRRSGGPPTKAKAGRPGPRFDPAKGAKFLDAVRGGATLDKALRRSRLSVRDFSRWVKAAQGKGVAAGPFREFFASVPTPLPTGPSPADVARAAGLDLSTLPPPGEGGAPDGA
jgi:hypothetical protein